MRKTAQRLSTRRNSLLFDLTVKNFSSVVLKLVRLGVLSKGYSIDFEEIMISIAYLCTGMFQGVVDVFTQSDEITILVKRKTGDFVHEFGGRRDKIISLSSAEVSSEFTKLITERILMGSYTLEDKLKTIKSLPKISFDSRIGTYDSYEDAYEMIVWRGYDCSVNGISQALHNCGIPGSKENHMNSDLKLDFLDKHYLLPLRDHKAYGTLLKREKILREFTCSFSGRLVVKERFRVRVIPGQIVKNIKEGIITLDVSND